MSAIMDLLGSRESSASADTGSATHAMINAFNNGKEIAEAIEFVRAANMFPATDYDEAKKLFEAYAKDTRNDPKSVVFSEVAVSFTLPAAKIDTTGKDIYITGTCDQIRTDGHSLSVWDYKTGKAHHGWDMLNVHALQLAAYTTGFSKTPGLKLPVVPGGIIRGQDYFKKNITDRVVFWHANFEFNDCKKLLDIIRYRVAEIRNKVVGFTPGSHCKYCPAKGLSNCMAIWKNI